MPLRYLLVHHVGIVGQCYNVAIKPDKGTITVSMLLRYLLINPVEKTVGQCYEVPRKPDKGTITLSVY